jgi:hypothetical protein
MIHSTYRAIYTNHAGQRTEREVNVHATTDEFGPCFYAEALATLGCGKNDADPIGAIHRLVQDHGSVIAIQSI